MAKKAKRGHIGNILGKKGRRPPRGKRWELVSSRIRQIEDIAGLVGFLDDLESMDSNELDEILERAPELRQLLEFQEVYSEVARYIPIGLVACIEGYFEIVYANLIDHGPPFRDNAAKFDDIQFSLEHLVSIERNSVSLGEFVAHSRTCSSIDDVGKSMSILIGEDFLGLVKKRYSTMRPTLFPEISSGNDLVRRVSEIFEARHTYCHEIDPPVDEQGFSWVDSYPKAAADFLLMSEHIVQQLLSDGGKNLKPR